MISREPCRTLVRLVLVLLAAGVAAFARAPVSAQEAERKWPDIEEPGLDLGDFPNSAFTIPAGTWQIEFSPFSYLGKDRYSSSEYFTQFLVRYGLTDDCEFRILGNGLTITPADPQNTGFSPLSLDMKVHLWDDKLEYLLPASSLEVALSTDWGSPGLSTGYQPSINMNFTLPLSETLALEWTVGYGEVRGVVLDRTPRPSTLTTENFNQLSFQWSVAKKFTDDFELFVTGTTAHPVAGISAGTGLAVGNFWRLSDRLMYYTVIGWGVTPDAPNFGAQIGFGIALGRPRAQQSALDADWDTE